MTENLQQVPEPIENEPVAKPRKGQGTFGAVWNGARGGMFFFVLLFALSLVTYSGFSIMDVQNETIENLIKDNYLTHIALFQVRILLAYLALGAFIGGFFGLVGGGFYKPSKRRSRFTCFFSGFVGAALIHLIMLLHGLGNTPGLFSKVFHEAGPPLNAFQGIATSLLVPPLTKTFLALVIFFALLTIARRIAPKLGPVVLVIFILGFSIAGVFYIKSLPTPTFSTDPSRPNILLLTADSLRYDKFGYFGYERGTTPNIDALAKQGILLTETYSPVARTFPSWASILTGQYAHNHGIRNMFPSPEEGVLKDSIAHAMKAQGYRTSVFSDYAGDVFPRMQAGFDHVQAPEFLFTTLMDTEGLKLHHQLLPYLDNLWARHFFPILEAFEDNADPKVPTDRFIDWLDKNTAEPFFTVMFYSPTHFPFALHYPHYKRYADPNYNGKYKFRKPPEPSTERIEETERQQIHDLFDAAMFTFDQQVGRIVQALKERGLYENTIIVITSDHGENLYDDLRDIGHGDHFRGNYAQRVPLLFHWPKSLGTIGQNAKRGQMIDGLTSHLDIVPTLLFATGQSAPGKIDGKDLAPLFTGEVDSVRNEVFAETALWFVELSAGYFKGRRISYPDISVIGQLIPENHWVVLKPEYKEITNLAKHRMVFDGRYKFIAIPLPKSMRYECYDTQNDPAEKHDLMLTTPGICAPYKEKIEAWMASSPGVELMNGFPIPVE